MNNNILLAFAINILPRLTLFFVVLLLLYKTFIKIRSKYSATVNCWFCNANSKVPYLQSNSWTCTKCEQYNGFSKDGGYNREIIQQFDCSNLLNNSMNDSHWLGESSPSNGFCDACNEAQRLKVEKLAKFEPKRESRFDEELRAYKSQLEEQYRLCSTCDRHLKSVLREKKKMVLGSKFIEYIIKGAEAIKHPQYNLLRQAKQELWKRRLSLLITTLTIINLCCLFNSLPELNSTWFGEMFGVSLGKKLFIACSHVVALWRVLTTFITTFAENDAVIKSGLFVRTIFLMMLYSLGLRLPHLVRINFLSLYMLAAPFCILASTFSYNVIDRFRITRYTLLLVIWSIYAGGLIDYSVLPLQQILMFLTSILTCLLTFTNKTPSSFKLNDDTANSFHKIYADDYLSETDTAISSILSNELDSSSYSPRSDVSRSFASFNRSTIRPMKKQSPITSSTFSLHNGSPPTLQPLKKSPLTSSMLSLNLTKKTMPEPSLNSSFKSCYGAGNRTVRSRLGNSVYSFAAPVRNPFMESASNLNGMYSNRTGSAINPLNNNLPKNATFAGLNDMQRGRTQGFQQLSTPAPSIRSSCCQFENAPSRLLSPSRFTFNTMTTGYSFGANSFQHQHSANPMLDQSLSTINEDLSRASSRSSGFESQNGHLNCSRENSCGIETNDVNKNRSMLDTAGAFQSFDNNSLHRFNKTLTPRPLLSPFSTYTQPLAVNCSSEWHTGHSNSSMFRDTDSFNLRQFNQNLPSFKRGDLLKKWKEGEVMS